jgi:hypothetical protein
MSPAYVVGRLPLVLEGIAYVAGDKLPSAAVGRLKPAIKKHQLDSGRIVLHLDGAPVAPQAAAAAVDVRKA